MGFVCGRVSTAAELEEVQRLRYTVYVDELGRYREAADDTIGTFADPRTLIVGSSSLATATRLSPRRA